MMPKNEYNWEVFLAKSVAEAIRIKATSGLGGRSIEFVTDATK